MLAKLSPEFGLDCRLVSARVEIDAAVHRVRRVRGEVAAAVIGAEFQRMAADDLSEIRHVLVDVVAGDLPAGAGAELAIGAERRQRIEQHVRDEHRDAGLGQEILALDFGIHRRLGKHRHIAAELHFQNRGRAEDVVPRSHHVVDVEPAQLAEIRVAAGLILADALAAPAERTAGPCCRCCDRRGPG